MNLTYLPFGLEFLETFEFLGNGLICQQRLVLPQRSFANLRVLGFRNCIFQESPLKLVERNDDAKEFGERVLKIALGAGSSEFDLLDGAGLELGWRETNGAGGGKEFTSSRLMVAERFVFGI